MAHNALFVGDNPRLVEELKLMFEPLAREWNMRFASGRAAALGLLATGPFDVLVTDSRLPVGDIGEFLDMVSGLDPRTVRITLADPSVRDGVAKLAGRAHRVLTKPCDAEALRTAFLRARSLQRLMNKPRLQEVAGRMGSLPTPPAVYAEVTAELQKSEPSVERLGRLLAGDMAMVAKLLQVANSAVMGLRRPVTTPAQAVLVLGTEMTRMLVVATGAFACYDPAALRPFSIDELWDHSRRVADLARVIATAEGADTRLAADAAVAGLLHDVGKLVLASRLPDVYKEVLALTERADIMVIEAERVMLGATHAELGAYLLGLWGLPETLVEAVAWHHTPAGFPGRTFTPLTAVHVADAIVHHREPEAQYLADLGLNDRLNAWRRLALELDGALEPECEVPV